MVQKSPLHRLASGPCLAVVLTALVSLSTPASAGETTEAEALSILLAPPHGVETGLDLVSERYRGLDFYADRVQVTQVLSADGRPDHRVETELQCEFTGDELTVTTPLRQLRRLVGLGRPVTAAGTPAARARRDYDLWLAPHLVFRFRDTPVGGFRIAAEPFEVTAVEATTLRAERLVARFRIESGRERFDLFVDPLSRLIVAVHGSERLPDGSTLRTEMIITPLRVDGRTSAPGDVEPISAGDLSVAPGPREGEPADIPATPLALPVEPAATEVSEPGEIPPPPTKR